MLGLNFVGTVHKFIVETAPNFNQRVELCALSDGESEVGLVGIATGQGIAEDDMSGRRLGILRGSKRWRNCESMGKK